MWTSSRAFVPANCAIQRRARTCSSAVSQHAPQHGLRPLTKTELRRLSVVTLRAELESRSLSAQGKKEDLVERLMAAYSADAQPAAARGQQQPRASSAGAASGAGSEHGAKAGSGRPAAQQQQQPAAAGAAEPGASAPPPPQQQKGEKRDKKGGGFDRVQAVRGKGLLNYEKRDDDAAPEASQPDASRDPGFSGMELEFLGTSSGQPTLWRNVSALGVRFPAENWLFDCGEGTQHRLMVSSLAYPRITRIFVTHTHGDHIFGLPGVIASISAARTLNSNSSAGKGGPAGAKLPLHIYGPQGLHAFIQGALQASHTVISMPVTVFELVDRRTSAQGGGAGGAGGGGAGGGGGEWGGARFNGRIAREEILPTLRPGVVPTWGEWDRHCADGRALPAWTVFEDADVSVHAAPLRHRVPCVGYVIHERPWMGHIDVERAAQLGLQPGKEFARLKRGEAVKNREGETVLPEDVIGPPRPGRKVCVLGDTCDSRAIEDLARHADVLVHESTFQNALKPLAERAGHSTAGMAGAFARRCGAKTLILTHFSNRYPSIKGRAVDRAAVDEALAAAEGVPMSVSADGLSAREEQEQAANAIVSLVREAAAEMGRGPEAVLAAFDFMRFPVVRKGPEDWPEGVPVPTVAELAEAHPNDQRRNADRRGGGRGPSPQQGGRGGAGGPSGAGAQQAQQQRWRGDAGAAGGGGDGFGGPSYGGGAEGGADGQQGGRRVYTSGAGARAGTRGPGGAG